MHLLGIETSCDETAAAIVKSSNQKVSIVSNVLSTSLQLHARTGGIIPEVAARQQLKFIIPVIDEALKIAKLKLQNIDAIAVTHGPGLIGSLLVGVETAKTLSFAFKKPIIPVNHLYGHVYANWLDQKKEILFPALALIVSGGHTDLVVMKGHNKLEWIGGTRDDAAGEAFDKIGRLLGMPYPAGPTIEKSAKQGDPKRFTFPRPMMHTDDFDFSFSGLKTAALREVQKIKKLDESTKNDLAKATQDAIIDVLVHKTLKAAEKFQVKSIPLSGGVAANQALRETFQSSIINHKSKIKLFAPTPPLCTDNAAMIASAAFYNYKKTSWQKISANPQLSFA